MSRALELNLLHARDRADWRRWLEANHEDALDGVWLVYYKPHAGKAGVAYNDSVEEALCFGWIDSLVRRLDDDRYARKFTPRKTDSQWSESNRKRVEKLIEQGLMQAPGLALVEAAKSSGRWLEDPRPKIDTRPSQAFRDALAKNRRAAAFFDGLTPAQQKHFVLWINSAKRPDTRARRIAESVRLLKNGEKLGMK